MVRPEASSKKPRAGVLWLGGMENGLAVTATSGVAMEKKITPLVKWPALDGVKARRTWRSVPSMALTKAPWPIIVDRL